MLTKLFAFYGLFLLFFAPKKSAFNFLPIIPLILFSLARGTSIEFSELFLFTLTLMFIKFNYISNRNKFFFFLSFFILIFIVGSVFLYQVQLRYNGEYSPKGCVYGFCYSKNFYLSDTLNTFLWVLVPYLLGGIYNLNVYISEFTFSMLFPLNAIFFGTEIFQICVENGYDCGAWKTLPILVAENFGLILAIIFYIGIPFLLRSFIRHSNSPFISVLGLYLFVYFIFSNFTGHGIIISYSNKLIVLILLLFYVVRTLRYK
jgi:hypothetical protein